MQMKNTITANLTKNAKKHKNNHLHSCTKHPWLWQAVGFNGVSRSFPGSRSRASKSSTLDSKPVSVSCMVKIKQACKKAKTAQYYVENV